MDFLPLNLDLRFGEFFNWRLNKPGHIFQFHFSIQRLLKFPNLETTWAVVVAQLVDRLLPSPEVHGLNLVIGKILSTNSIIEKTKINKKRPGKAHLKKDL